MKKMISCIIILLLCFQQGYIFPLFLAPVSIRDLGSLESPIKRQKYPSGIEGALQMVKDIPNAWVLYGSILSRDLLKKYYGSNIVDFFDQVTLQTVKNSVNEKEGVVLRITDVKSYAHTNQKYLLPLAISRSEDSDIIAILPETLSAEEIDELLWKIQCAIERIFEKYSFCLVKGKEPKFYSKYIAQLRRKGQYYRFPVDTTVRFSRDHLGEIMAPIECIGILFEKYLSNKDGNAMVRSVLDELEMTEFVTVSYSDDLQEEVASPEKKKKASKTLKIKTTKKSEGQKTEMQPPADRRKEHKSAEYEKYETDYLDVLRLEDAIFMPYCPFGAVPKNTEEKFLDSIVRASRLQRKAVEKPSFVGVEGFSDTENLGMDSDKQHALFSEDLEKSIIASNLSELSETQKSVACGINAWISNSESKLQAVNIEKEYGTFHAECLPLIVQFVKQRKIKQPMIFVVRNPPDGFYLVVNGPEGWQVICINFSVQTIISSLESEFTHISEKYRFPYRRKRFDIRVLNIHKEKFGHKFVNQLITLYALLLWKNYQHAVRSTPKLNDGTISALLDSIDNVVQDLVASKGLKIQSKAAVFSSGDIKNTILIRSGGRAQRAVELEASLDEKGVRVKKKKKEPKKQTKLKEINPSDPLSLIDILHKLMAVIDMDFVEKDFDNVILFKDNKTQETWHYIEEAAAQNNYLLLSRDFKKLDDVHVVFRNILKIARGLLHERSIASSP